MKNEKQESPAAEILWLRGLRAFVAENRVRGNSRALNSAEKPRCMPRPVRMIFRMRSGWRAP